MEGNFIVTGAAQGFGQEFTRRILKKGGRVVLADKNITVGQQTTRMFQEEFGGQCCMFQETDVSSKEDWETLWARAEVFFQGTIDVLVNNAGVSPVLPFDTVMKVNLTGVLHGSNMFASKQSVVDGGTGGLVVNIASMAGLSYGFDRNGISYQISKHAVVDATRSFASKVVVNKTGIKHVAICPWFAETALLDGMDKNKIKEKVKFSFVSVERVGEAFETVVKDQCSGSLMVVMSGCPLIYYPDLTMPLLYVTMVISKLLGTCGVRIVSVSSLASVFLLVLLIFCYCFHIILTLCGL